jgi:Na+-translocating ferredoxin:NAD+ oxidoreductase subunit B
MTSPDEPALPPESPRPARRLFLLWCGRAAGVAAIGGVAARVLMANRQGEESDAAQLQQPAGRYAWQIDTTKCTYCGKCATACVRTPSAVRAVNDQKACSNCVVCYGHIYNREAKSEEINQQGKVCPLGAVCRSPFPPDSKDLDGRFLYTIRDELCNGCGACARECNAYGNKSMFLVLRPDLCLGCHECAIAGVCPSDALKYVPLESATDYRSDVPHQS